MAYRLATIKINGETQLILAEKHCSALCPCEKGNATPASITLANLEVNCALHRIPSLIRGSLEPQINTHWEMYSKADFEEHCKTQRTFHLGKMAESIRHLANPCNSFSRSILMHKIWNEQAAKVYSEYITANAINGSELLDGKATVREPKIKSLSDALYKGFTFEHLASMVSALVPNLETLRTLPKEKQGGRGPNSEWKSAFPAIVAALMNRGYLTRDISDKALERLFSKDFGVDITDRTYAKARAYDEQTFTNDYFEKAVKWLEAEGL